jgi:hypothetical protein
MELRDALVQIAEIRRQMAKNDVFRGYRSAPVAFSGLLAVVGAIAQTRFVADPLAEVPLYLTVWMGMAVLSVAAVVAEMAVRMVWTHDYDHRTAVDGHSGAAGARAFGAAARRVANPVQPGHLCFRAVVAQGDFLDWRILSLLGRDGAHLGARRFLA